MTTNYTANMLKSTSNIFRCVCFCHRINIIIPKAVDTAKCHPNFQELILKPQEVSKYMNRTDLKYKMSLKIRFWGKTRPCRYYIFLFTDILYHKVNSTNLTSLLISNNKYFIVESINQDILSETMKLLEPFKNALDLLKKKLATNIEQGNSFLLSSKKTTKRNTDSLPIQLYYKRYPTYKS